MDAATALARMKLLLAPGGALVIIGVARPQPAGLPLHVAATLAHRGYRLTRGYWQHPYPVAWPPPHTYRQIRVLAQQTLPGVRYRQHLLWRYSLIWTKPAPARPGTVSSLMITPPDLAE